MEARPGMAAISEDDEFKGVEVVETPDTGGRPEQTRLRVGIMGAGRGGQALLRVLYGIPQVQVVGICDLNPGAPGLEEARRQDIPIYGDVFELLQNQPLDWLFNVSHNSITQRHLLSRELAGVTVVDGATGELVWRVLMMVHEHVKALGGLRCSHSHVCAVDCTIDLGWSLIQEIVRAAEEVQEEVAGIAFLDPLTGLYTRRMLMDYLDRQIHLARRQKQPLSVLLVDIDHFKPINDRYGHAEGDRVLRQFADLLQGCSRSMDLVARIGGEEFTVVLPMTRKESARVFAERLRSRVQQELLRPDQTPLTVSIGIAYIEPEQDVPPELDGLSLIKQADEALYGAKNEGRNRIALFDPSPVQGEDGGLGTP